MQVKQLLKEEVFPIAVKLCRRRRSIEIATRVGLPAAGFSLFVYLMQGIGLLPYGSGLAAASLSLLVIGLSAFIAAKRILKPEDGLDSLGNKDSLADAVRSALELSKSEKETNDAYSEAMVQAHVKQTKELLLSTPGREVFGAHNLQRLQVMTVLCICVVSVALL